MTIKSRLKKLETASPTSLPRKVLFKYLVPARDGRQSGPSVLHHAVIAGTNFGKIMRDKDETEPTFTRRVYAMAAADEKLA